MGNTLKLLGDKGVLAEVDITREHHLYGDDVAGGDLSAQGGNLYLEIDGKELGSLWIRFTEDGEPIISLGQFVPELEGWEERSTVKHIPLA